MQMESSRHASKPIAGGGSGLGTSQLVTFGLTTPVELCPQETSGIISIAHSISLFIELLESFLASFRRAGLLLAPPGLLNLEALVGLGEGGLRFGKIARGT